MSRSFDDTYPHPTVPALLHTLSERDLKNQIILLRQHRPRNEWIFALLGTSWQSHCDDVERLIRADKKRRGDNKDE